MQYICPVGLRNFGHVELGDDSQLEVDIGDVMRKWEEHSLKEDDKSRGR